MGDAILSLTGVAKRFGDRLVLDGVSLTASPGVPRRWKILVFIARRV